MAVLLPGAPDLAAYWQNLLGGIESISEAPPHRWDPQFYDPAGATEPHAERIYCRRGGFVDEYAYADPLRFGIPPADVAGIEPDQLLALQVAASAIDDAGGATRLGDPARVGVILGRGGYLGAGLARLDQRLRTAHQLVSTLGTLLPALGADELDRIRAAFTDQLGPQRADGAIGMVPNLAASRIANRLDLRGPAYTVDAACASSLIAVDSAVTELAAGRCDAVLAGGVHHCHDITLWSTFAQLGALSARQQSRPFDRAADGILIGEGTGVVVLKRLDDAQRAGDRVYAVIRGTGTSSDGRGGGLVNPEPAGQALAVERAWAAAGLDPRARHSVGMIEAHGTATPAGDAAELATLAQVFGSDRDDVGVLGSVKSMIGHAMAAAGVAGLVKAALALHNRVLLPAVNCEDPHPALARTRFRPLLTAAPWESAGPRRAGVNAFGFGGTNAHVLLEEAPPPTAPRAGTGAPGSPAGVGSPGARRDPTSAGQSAAPAAAGAGTSVGGTSRGGTSRGGTAGGTTSEGGPAGGGTAGGGATGGGATGGGATGVPAATVREPDVILRFAAATPRELAGQLDADDATLRATAGGPPAYTGPGARLGLVHPTPRRLAAARHAAGGARTGAWDAWRGRSEVWYSASGLLAGPKPARVAFVFPGLEAEFAPRLDDVCAHFGFALPRLSADGLGTHGSSVLAASRVLDRTLRRLRVEPDAVAGHSIGEWSAMFAAGLFDEAEVDADIFGADPYEGDVPEVDYASLSCSRDDALAAIADHPGVVLSHDNAPAQTVVCGPPARIAELARGLRRRNVVVQILPFRSGFHTPMLRPYLAGLRERTQRMRIRRAPQTELWSATTASPYPEDTGAIRELFVRHLLEPVLFRQVVEAMAAAGVGVFVQVGPGRLGGLVDATLESTPHLTIAANSSERDGLGQLRRLAVALWVEHGDP
ncbi:beta-ketoacyl synthase N-terminal-like domain-containing protein, partial [Frankia sp. ACN1ag]|uniref:beta-ketoacyl synthase N-terminal-like domain-containing protein n=1 Tax=Frankia sp. ACN1ag TaxID=102891 RepID=UPI0037BFA879